MTENVENLILERLRRILGQPASTVLVSGEQDEVGPAAAVGAGLDKPLRIGGRGVVLFSGPVPPVDALGLGHFLERPLFGRREGFELGKRHLRQVQVAARLEGRVGDEAIPLELDLLAERDRRPELNFFCAVVRWHDDSREEA